MKQPKRPKLEQKKAIREAGLDWKNWSVAADYGDTLYIISKKSGQRRIIHK